MQNDRTMPKEVRSLISHLTTWSGLSGPIPNVVDLRFKREQARQATLGATILGRETITAPIRAETRRRA